MPLALMVAIAFSAAINQPQVQNVQQYVESYFADAPVMVRIARCESHFRQFEKDGSVYRGKITPKDVGIMQVNEHYHADTASKMGLDLYTIDGNITYARYLYEKEGTKPWNSSSACWLKPAKADGSLALAAK